MAWTLPRGQPGTGNCLFLAISDWLAQLDLPYDHKSLRAKACTHLKKYEDRYEKYFEGKKRQQEEETYVMLPPIKTNNCVNITFFANLLDFPWGVKDFTS